MSIDAAPTRQRNLSERTAGEIRAEMGRRQMSGRKLAQKMGRSPNWVSLKTSGASDLNLEDVEKICAALEIDPVDLIRRASVTLWFTDKIAFAATPSIPAPRVASTPVPALAGRFASATLATVQPSGPRRTAPTGR